MNAKKARKLRQDLRARGINPSEATYAKTTYHQKLVMPIFEMVSVPDPITLVPGSGRKQYQLMKKVFAHV